MESMFQRLWVRFLRVGEIVLDALEKGIDYQTLQQKVRGELDGLGRDILRSVIEAADENLRQNRSERAGWVIAQTDHEKELLTQFGPMTYRRTYFKHAATNTHA